MASHSKKRVTKPEPTAQREPTLVARRIQEIRDAKGWTRQQLADRMNATRQPDQMVATRLYVWRIETGFTHVSAEAAVAFAAGLDVSVASLYREARAS